MATEKYAEILRQGGNIWNHWRSINSCLDIDLFEVDLKKADLQYADLHEVNLGDADLRGADLGDSNLSIANLSDANLGAANLFRANLNDADLRSSNLSGVNASNATFIRANLRLADLSMADFSGADFCAADLRDSNFGAANFTNANFAGANLRGVSLRGANFSGANLSNVDLNGMDLSGMNLSGANLSGANLEYARLVNTDFSNAILNDCCVFGVSAWGVNLNGVTSQKNLRITPTYEQNITVDNLEVAQFVYLLLYNEKIRSLIDTIGRKGVLILGRFSKERKEVLDSIRNKLRESNFVPIMFDFEKPDQRDFTETIKILAGMCRFIIADITNPKSCPLELQATVPDFMIPFIPIIQDDEKPFSMFIDLQKKYDWVLDVLKYDTAENLIKVFDIAVIKPALEKADELSHKKTRNISERHITEYL